jgi:hypothetical protein
MRCWACRPSAQWWLPGAAELGQEHVAWPDIWPAGPGFAARLSARPGTLQVATQGGFHDDQAGCRAVSTPEAAARLAEQAQLAAREAVARVIVGMAPGASPAEVVRIARSVELAVHAEVVGHIRRAREAGESWAAVGELLGFGPIAGEGPGTLAELGFDYAAGPRTIDPWFPEPPMFVWDCPGCGQRIADHGPAKGPVSDQDGHKDGCVRLAAEAADWEQEAPR